MATDVKNSSLATNLVSYWELEESSGTRVDSHGSNDLTENGTGGIAQGTGIQGSCADFTASDSEYLSIADGSQSGLDITNTISISLWVNLETNPTGGGAMFFVDKGNTGLASTRGYMVYVYESSGNIILRFQYWDNNGVTRAEATNVVTASTGWNHIVCTANPGAATPTAIIYVDGTSVATASTTNASFINNTSQPFHIGAESSANSFTDGLIDEVGIWNRELSSSDVTSLYNSGSGIPYDGGGAGGATTAPTLLTLNVG